MRPDLLKIVNRVVGNPESSVLSEIEHCLYSGYDRKKTAAKLSGIVESKKASRISEKLEDLLDDFKASLKSRKRSNDDNAHAATETPKKPKTNRFDVPPTAIPAAEPPKPPPVVPQEAAPQVTASSLLTSDQIKSMMDNAQRQIEARKTALQQAKQNAAAGMTSTDGLEQPTKEGEERNNSEPPAVPTLTEADREARLAQIRARISGTLATILPQAVIVDKPKPLILDAEGRTVDKSGREINIPTLEPTLKANIRALKRDGFNKPTGPVPTHADRSNEEPQQPQFFDERIGVKVPARNRRALRFHEPGKFMQQADRMRMKAQLEKLQNEISQIARKTGISSATKLALIAPKTDSKTDEVPQMEWWDSVILVNDLATTEEDGRIAIREVAITNLIEHPTQIKPPSE